ncbi:sodium:solute symporter family protein [Pseudomonas saudiphocaensis]|jgi:cation/acetate symporter|uniref:sodium:solute symporter family protein n=1 Tax=Pseudomonas saudiphocaensis TaxID=1499686 RepID=UPI000F77DC61|nr:sodium:solute symporter family protein [Pseudomonas saudiphocaensis]RRV17481.1 cation acetate symporter [Pseudomonas saudiphocaensis]
MSQFAINLIFVLGSFAIYTAIAIWARAKSTREFYIAGGEVNPTMNGMATAADWLSAASFISVAGLISVGYVNSAFIMGWTGGYVLLATLLAPYLRRFGTYTVPDFIGKRYASKTARVVAVVCLIIISLTYVIGQMTGAGVAFARFLEVEVSTGLLISSVVVFFYAVLGGMKGVTYTQVAQYIVLILAYTIPAVYLSLMITGHFLPQTGFVGSHVESGVPMLQKLNEVVRDLGFQDYTADVSNKWNMLLFTLTLMVGTAGLPHVIIRFFTVPNIKDARRSAAWALVFIALFYTTAPAMASMARLNLLETIFPQGTDQPALAYEERPQWFKNWEVTGLLVWEDKNNDGRVQFYNDGTLPTPDKSFAPTAEARGWAGNELKVNNDILVLALPEIANMPPWLIGLMAAGGIAAALSTASGLMLAISSAVSHDLLKNTLMPHISDKTEMLYARLSMVGAISIATWLGLNPPGFAAQTVALAFGIAAASIFPALMMGIFIRRINSKGAVCGMVAGASATMVYIFLYLGWFFIPGTATFPNTPEYYLFGIISPLSFGCIGAVINFTVAIAVSNATERPTEEIQEMVRRVRYP